jgi:hypothetical protein
MFPVFGEGGVGSASVASKEERPHPALPEDADGGTGTNLPGMPRLRLNRRFESPQRPKLSFPNMILSETPANLCKIML